MPGPAPAGDARLLQGVFSRVPAGATRPAAGPACGRDRETGVRLVLRLAGQLAWGVLAVVMVGAVLGITGAIGYIAGDWWHGIKCR